MIDYYATIKTETWFLSFFSVLGIKTQASRSTSELHFQLLRYR